MHRIHRYGGMGLVSPVISDPVLDCPDGGMRVNGVCRPGSVGPLPYQPPPSSGTGGICPSWGCEGYNPISFPPMGACPTGYTWTGETCVPNSVSPIPYEGNPAELTVPVTTVETASGPEATTIDPATGQIVTSIPPSGPQPPGAGYQQVEEPGSAYPYVYIGGGSVAPTQEQCPPGYELYGSTCLPLDTGGIAMGPGTGIDAAYPGWMESNPPQGSYLESCSNVESDGVANLWAECANQAGQYEETSLYYAGCQTAPYNQNGQLGCGGPGGQQIFTPASGSPSGYLPYQSTPYGVSSPLVASPYGYPATAAPWSVYQSYPAGSTVTYAGVTWTALIQSTGVAPGSNAGYWVMATGSPYQASPYNLPLQMQSQQVPAAQMTGGAAAGAGSTASNWFNQYKWWILAVVAGVIILPRMLKSGR